MLIGSIIIYLLLSFFLTIRCFKELSFSKWVINIFLVVTCSNILIAEILHFLRLLNNSWVFLLIQLLLSVVVIIVLWDPKKKIFTEPIFPIHFAPIRVNGIDLVLTLVIVIILVGVFVIGTLSPINNSDSLHTHLPRIYYWLQHGSFESWDAITATQISYPINISIQGLWIFLLGKSEMLFYIVPWFGLVAAVTLIYEISLLLGASKRGALLASLVTMTFPVVVLQSYSYQGDVYVTTLTLTTIFFVLLFLKNKNPYFIYLSGLAIAVALGSKQTAILFIPVYAIALLLLLVKKHLSWRILFKTIGWSFLFFLMFSSLKVFQNQIEEKVENSYMVSPTFAENLVTATKKPFEGYAIKSLRYFYQSVSLDGLAGSTKINADKLKLEIFRGLTEKMGVDLENPDYSSASVSGDFSYENQYAINEDAAWFGPLFYPIFLLAILVVLFNKNKMAKIYLLISCILMAIFIFSQVVLKSEWGANRGRHMTIAVLSIAPLIAFIIPKKRFVNGIISLILAFLSLFLTCSVLLFNDSRPLLGQHALLDFSENYVGQIKVTNIFNSQYRQRLYELSTDLMLTAPTRATILDSTYDEKLYYQNTYELPNLAFVNQYIRDQDRIFIMTDKTLLEYALFGVNRTREVYPIKDHLELTSGSYLLVSKSKNIEIADYQLVDENDDYQVYYIP